MVNIVATMVQIGKKNQVGESCWVIIQKYRILIGGLERFLFLHRLGIVNPTD